MGLDVASAIPDSLQEPVTGPTIIINGEGFLSGQIATLTQNQEEGDLMPVDTDFIITNLIVTDLDGTELFGYSIDISAQQLTVTL